MLVLPKGNIVSLLTETSSSVPLGRTLLPTCFKGVEKVSSRQCVVQPTSTSSGEFEVLSQGQYPTLVVQAGKRYTLLRGHRVKLIEGGQIALTPTCPSSAWITFTTAARCLAQVGSQSCGARTPGADQASKRPRLEDTSDQASARTTALRDMGAVWSSDTVVRAEALQEEQAASSMEARQPEAGGGGQVGQVSQVEARSANTDEEVREVSQEEARSSLASPSSSGCSSVLRHAEEEATADSRPGGSMLILVGPPGAGKSFFSKQLPEEQWVRVNQDSVRGGRPGSRKQCLRSAQAAIRMRRHVVVDRCNMTADQRADFIALAHQARYTVLALVLAFRVEECEGRVARRQGHEGGVEGAHSTHIVAQQASTYSPPTIQEGFSSVAQCGTEEQVQEQVAHFAALPLPTGLSPPAPTSDPAEGLVAPDADMRRAVPGGAGPLPSTWPGFQRRFRSRSPSSRKGAGERGNAAGDKGRRVHAEGTPAGAGRGGGAAQRADPSQRTLAGTLRRAPSSQAAGRQAGTGLPPSTGEVAGAKGGDALASLACPPASARRKWGRFPGADALVKAAAAPESSEAEVLQVDHHVVVLRDKYPKARHHWLVVARDPALEDLSCLQPHHLPLLHHMLAVAQALQASAAPHSAPGEHEASANGATQIPCRFGFHAGPSLQQLHLHVVSQDLQGPAMKNKKHWNSFTTEFFRPLAHAIAALEAAHPTPACTAPTTPLLPLLDPDAESRMLKRDLCCHRCAATLKNMPALKSHLAQCTAPYPT